MATRYPNKEVGQWCLNLILTLLPQRLLAALEWGQRWEATAWPGTGDTEKKLWPMGEIISYFNF